MKKINLVIRIIIISTVIFAARLCYASVNITVKNEGNIVFTSDLDLPGAGMVDISDSGGSLHPVDSLSVLNIVTEADADSPDFNISNLTYYASFNAFYLNCITVAGNELCDNWQYKVDDVDPGLGMDQSILSDGQKVVLYYGSEEPASKASPSHHHRYFLPRPAPAVVPQEVVTIITPDLPKIEEVAPVPEPTAAAVVEVAPPLKVATVINPRQSIPIAIGKTKKNKVQKIESVAAESTANVVAANTESTTTRSKGGWVNNFFKWLFNF